jgi:hypothetical protein
LYRLINGIKCFVKYRINYDKNECNVWVYSKIYSKELEYTFIDIKKKFNPKAAIRRLRIVYSDSRKPYMMAYDNLEETYVDTSSETLYYTLPKQIISYVYGCAETGLYLVTYQIKKLTNSNKLEVKIIEPSMFLNENKEAFTKVIDPVHLFRYLRMLNIESSDYEIGLNPFRYRAVITINNLKQYLRENLYIGELEVEPLVSKKANRRISTENTHN